jgi:histidyl-tRNA synthetase
LFRSPRGTADILPEEQHYWRYIESRALEICRLYGYRRIDTPAFEDAGLFTRSIGEGTDIVTKEMYAFQDQSGNNLSLRPEGTAPVCRAYLEHGMDNITQPVKLYYFAAIFRYERPQAGRYRQHYQFGCEAIGETAPSLDAEVIDMSWQFFSSLGLKQISLQLNSIGCKICRPKYLESLRQHYSAHIEGLCQDCKTRMEKNTLRLLDCKKPFCQDAANKAPKSSAYLCQECDDHFRDVKKYLGILEIPFIINHRLVRGLDYYTKTVFEIHPPEEASQSALGGGGRYDNLIEQLGGKATPAIGFATGMERIVLNLKKQNIAVTELSKPKLFIAFMGEEAKLEAISLASSLRRQGISAIAAGGDRSLKAQLRQANGFGIDQVAIIGEDEVKNKVVTLRNMLSGEQETVTPDKIAAFLK